MRRKSALEVVAQRPKPVFENVIPAEGEKGLRVELFGRIDECLVVVCEPEGATSTWSHERAVDVEVAHVPGGHDEEEAE